MTNLKYEKNTITFEYIKWTGGNFREVVIFTDYNCYFGIGSLFVDNKPVEINQYIIKYKKKLKILSSEEFQNRYL